MRTIGALRMLQRGSRMAVCSTRIAVVAVLCDEFALAGGGVWWWSVGTVVGGIGTGACR